MTDYTDGHLPALTSDDQQPLTAAETVREVRREIAVLMRTSRAETDYEAVATFLDAMAHNSPPCSPTTIATYRTILLRFLRWYAAYRHGQPLEAFAYEDVLAYQAFMRDPPEDWIGPKRVKNAADKRPFHQPLSEAEVARNSAVIRRLFRYLRRQGRIFSNPWATDAPKGLTRKGRVDQERHLTGPMWHALWETMARLEAAADDSDRANAAAHVARQRWTIYALYLTGLRADEAAASVAGQLFADRRGRGLWFDVPESIAKGGKAARIPVPQLFADELARYRMSLGISPARPPRGDATPLIMDLRGRRAVTRRTLWNIVTEVCCAGADALEADDPEDADVLRQASPHWLRHSRATHLLDAGIDRRIVRSIMRHSNDSTLDQYVHADDAHKQAGARVDVSGTVPVVNAG